MNGHIARSDCAKATANGHDHSLGNQCLAPKMAEPPIATIPLRTLVTGPVNRTPPLRRHSTSSTPALVRTRTRRPVRPDSTAATTAAQLPVPDDLVSPTPRSQKCTSISDLESTWTNSTLVRFGKRGCRSISRPSFFQFMPPKAPTKTVQCGFPIDVTVTGIAPCRVGSGAATTGPCPEPPRNGILAGFKIGRPMRTM